MHEIRNEKSRWGAALILNAVLFLVGFGKMIPEARADATTAGTTTRYWDCGKPGGAWPGKASVSKPVQSCAKDGKTSVDPNTRSATDGGTAYMCANQQPWSVSSTLAYGYAAASIAGQAESNWMCACYKMDFTTAPLVGKSMIVQVINTGSDLGSGHFDLLIPGGGVGIFNACTSQYNAPSSGWGAQYGGVSSDSQCSSLPTDLQPGCHWRFGGSFFQNANNPSMKFQRVKCPSEITARTGCVRSDEATLH